MCFVIIVIVAVNRTEQSSAERGTAAATAKKCSLDLSFFLFFIFCFSFSQNAGAFLIPYMIMVFVVGIPIFFAELFVGQYSGFGAIKAYAHLAPFFSGKYRSEKKPWRWPWNIAVRISHRRMSYTCE